MHMNKMNVEKESAYEIIDCVEHTQAQIIVPAADMDMEITVACGADLMSDVMAFACSSATK